MTLRNLSDDMPSITLNFEGAKKLDPRVTFTRASYAPASDPASGTGTVGGGVQTFNVNVPRLTDKGLLIEESRTNSLTTQNFSDNTFWTEKEASASASTVISPDGTTNAYELTESSQSLGVTTDHYIATISKPATTGKAWCWSVYAKPNGRDYLRVHFPGEPGGYVVFDIANGTKVVESADPSQSKGEIHPAGNGWYRCIVKEPNTGTARQLRLQLQSAPNTTNYQGDGTSGAYICFGQLEEGTFPTSYIPTSGAEVTRAKDICDLSLTGWWDESVQTWTGDFQTNSLEPNKAIVTILSGNERPLEFVANTGSDTKKIRIGNGKTPNAYSELEPANQTGLNKAAGVIMASKVQGYVNGNRSSTPTPRGSLPTGTFTTAHIGWYGGLGTDEYHLDGYISRISYYPTQLSDTALQGLTQ